MRRILFGVTALIFLLCQSAAIAAACQGLASSADATAVQAPCHETSSTDFVAADSACQAGCPTQFTAATPPQLQPAASILPVVTLGIDPPPAVTCSRVHDHTFSDRAQPPPLSRLYCRMLN